ncbi:MAG: nuclear transport factor 2 family protein [Alphaproteobacteria bacterium]|nr:nuclear transport factor 2 family protein [Alphaproteobacteria bacterium]
MTRDEMIDLVRTYFAAVDGEDLPGVLATLTEDCRFTVETHGVELTGHEAISGMFRRLWGQHEAVLHDRFTFVVDPEHDRIAARFKVTNTHQGGRLVHKSNCNFFTVRDDRFDSVAVYMAGENTLDRA